MHCVPEPMITHARGQLSAPSTDFKDVEDKGIARLYRLGGGAAEGRGAAHYRAGRPPRGGNLSPQTASCIQQPRRLPVLAWCRQPLQPSVEPLRGFLQTSQYDLHIRG